MSPGMETSRENLTLTDAELAACKPLAGEGGHVLRALCPFHGSDHQRSLRVQVSSGRFVCFACGAWGYLAEARERWQAERPRQAAFQRPAARVQRAQRPRPAAAAVKPPAPRLPRRVSLPQRGQNSRSSSLRSRPRCRGAAGKRTSASAGFRWRWPSSTAWAMRRRGTGHTPPATGAAAAWSFRIPRRMVAW